MTNRAKSPIIGGIARHCNIKNEVQMGLTEKPLVQGIPADADMAKADIDDDENIDVETVPEYPPEFVELLKRVSDLEKCVYGRSRE